MTFKRARSEEQQAIRRQSILDTAAAMLREMPVAKLSLNELSRRVGLAKSNVLRYFETREAVLLELTTRATGEWLDQLDTALATEVDATAPVAERCDLVAATVAATVARHPMLCELISTQAAVLERNVSTEVAVTYKRAALADTTRLADLVHRHVPELDTAACVRFAVTTALLGGAIWTHAHPSDAVRAAYRADPELTTLQLEFVPALTESLRTVLAGLLARTDAAT